MHTMEIARIVEIVSAFRRESLSEERVEVVPDLEIVGLYAARVSDGADYVVNAETGRVELVAFEHWPPERSAPRAADGDKTTTAPRRKRIMRIEQLMSGNVQHCAPNDTLDVAAGLMWNYDCGCVPVCAGNGSPRVVGMITDRDICMSALFAGKPLSDLRVADAMSREIYVCQPTDSPVRVERLMRERQIRRVPVVDDSGTLVGLFSLADLARCLTREALAKANISDADVSTTLAAIVEEPARVAR
jgi:CBS domain-containing protein